ncbi:diguanylate cyclase [Propionivibrio sp.]|uniref:GGDEF domain-containing protein n=1 Tax=Propionivibrio sp. TaxID=2212460 RepID=UPI003BF3ED2D
MAPSPDNYRAIYNEISGVVEKSATAFPESELKALLLSLPKETSAQQRLSRQLDQFIKGKNWEDYKKTLAEFIKEHSTESELGWSDLITEFLRQWEAKQSNLTPARKRESLEHVLASASKNSEILFGRLQSLIKSWSLNSAEHDDMALVDGAIDARAEAPVTATSLVTTAPVSRASELLPELRSLFAYTLEVVVATQLDDEPELAAQAKTLASAVRNASSVKVMDQLLADIKRFAFRLEFLAEDRNELRSGLLKLLQLMIENVSELVVDDHWLNGQISIVREIVAQPMNLRTLHDAEHRLKDVIFKQSQLKHSLIEAKEALKHMLAGFVDHLSEFADSTSDYHDKIEICVAKISKAEDITQLEDVLAEVISETRIIQINAQRSRDDLRASKQRVEEAEKQINKLQGELDKTSNLVRHDQLTGALNRRGLEETFAKESARAQRRQSIFCIAMLDIDNFKKLNDTLGHDAGDAALIHLVTVIRETLRPQDTLSRFGGEEFLIILPDTPIDDAKKAIARLQRELTKRFFLHDNEKVLITFSAGVTDFRRDDTQASVTKRADEAMYAAKKAGKNRVNIL